jgi:hypothetical protein
MKSNEIEKKLQSFVIFDTDINVVQHIKNILQESKLSENQT